VKPSPVGIISPFWLPPTATSTRQSSMRKSMLPSEEIVSASSRAGWRAASIAARMRASGSVIPVEVSLCTAQTARISCAWSASSAARTASGSQPRRQSAATVVTCRPRSAAICDQSSEKCPVSTTSSRSPGENRLTRLASQAEWPEPV